MKQSLRQQQKLSIKITPNLGNQIKLLSLNGFEISSKLNKLVEKYLDEDDKKVNYFKDEYLLDRYKNILYSGTSNENRECFQLKEPDLKEKLLDQLSVEPLGEVENLIGEFLIDSIESNGRLDPELDFQDIKRIVFEDFRTIVDDQEIEEVLTIIQNFEPAGCAFRSINESLEIQINHLSMDTNQKEVLRKTLKNLINHKILLSDLPNNIKNSLKNLSLDLGGNFGQSHESYLRPDVIALKGEGSWHVSLNDDFMSKELLEEIKNKIDLSKDEESMNHKSFLVGLERRHQTLIVVSKILVEVQNDYLNEKTDKRAISNKEIADKLNISPSTVSRIVRNKFIQFPDKVVPLKNLLEKRLNKLNKGNDITSSDLKQLIEELIMKEDKSNPRSDESLKSTLQDELGISISRRTITKYRTELKIPSTRSRS